MRSGGERSSIGQRQLSQIALSDRTDSYTVTRKSITNQIRRLALRGCCRAPMRRQNLSKSVQQWRLNGYNEHRQANMKMIMTTDCYITFYITAKKCKPAVIPGFYPQLFFIEFLIVMASVALLIRLIIFCVFVVHSFSYSTRRSYHRLRNQSSELQPIHY